ncbi:MAG: protecting protein DprA [Francisellaceae bacterium]|nr:protecting protein DprA [Francisellaceae bacterium]
MYTPLSYLLALLRMPGMGPVRLKAFLEKYNDKLADLFKDADAVLGRAPQFEPLKQYLSNINWGLIEQDLKWAESSECHIISIFDDLYPKLLKQIYNPPPILFVKGNPKFLSAPQISIVGSRNPTVTGKENAFKFAECFSKLNITVTSGLARGIDTSAHLGALRGEGQTIAVLGHGLDRIYPFQNKKLAEEIIEKGALISEYPLGTPPLAHHFPRRNRIISGMALGVVVVEAALKSGSLITAKEALEQSREVFAIPGSIHSMLAKGCHVLIKQGAKLIESPEDVLVELEYHLQYQNPDKEYKLESGSPKKLPFLNTEHEIILNHLDYITTPIDLLALRSGLEAHKISSILFALEKQGQITCEPGGYARKNPPHFL